MLEGVDIAADILDVMLHHVEFMKTDKSFDIWCLYISLTSVLVISTTIYLMDFYSGII